MWFGTENSLILLDGDRTTRWTDTDGLPDETVYCLLEATDGLWVGTFGGLARFDGQRFDATPLHRDLAGVGVRCLYRAGDDALWIGTEGAGAFEFDGTEITRIGRAQGMLSDAVWSIAQDREGNMWLGTYRGGVTRVRETPFTLLTPRGGLADEVVRSIHEDIRGRYWIGTYRGGVTLFDGPEHRNFGTEDGLPHAFVLSCAEDRRSGELWFGTLDGLCRFDGEASSFQSFPDSRGLRVRELHVDDAGTLWVGTDGHGLGFFRNEAFVPVAGSPKRVYCLWESAAGAIWIGAESGLHRFDRGENAVHVVRAVVNDVSVSQICADDDGNLWFGSEGDGLFRIPAAMEGDRDALPLEVETLDHWSDQNGLSNGYISQLVFDERGMLWVGNHQGLDRIDVARWNDSRTTEIRHYDPIDDATRVEHVHNAVLRDSRDRLWFGTVEGIVRYSTERSEPDGEPPVTHLTGVRVFFEERDGLWTQPAIGESAWQPTQPVEVAWNQNHLTFAFCGLKFSAPGKVRYRFRMEGFDRKWSPATRRKYATYSNLPSGRYRFEVQSGIDGGPWTSSAAGVDVVVLAPFWRTRSFFAFSLAVAVALIAGIVSWRTRSLTHRGRELQLAVASKTRELQLAKVKLEEANQHLLDAQASLEARVAERTEELAHANQRLERGMAERCRLEAELIRAEKTKSLSVLAGGVAHDFNNYLTAILGNLSLAREQSTDEVSAMLAGAEAATLDARTLTSQLLAISRGGSTHKHPIEIAGAVEQSARFAGRGLQSRLVFGIRPSVWAVEADEGQIRQVIHNLVLNADQSMPGGGEIRVCVANRVLTEGEVPDLAAGKWVHISVEDHGVGIAPDQRDQIFDPYFTTRVSGRGLGLAAAATIVRNHDGSITVDSELGRGSTFHVFLPATPVRPESGPEPGVTIQPHGGGRLLIMDDEPTVREVAGRLAGHLGYDYELVADGAAAIEHYRRADDRGEPFDVVILDLTVPGGLGGREALPELFRIDPHIRAIACSGYAKSPVSSDPTRTGFAAFLAKPFNLRELGTVLNHVLDGARSQAPHV